MSKLTRWILSHKKFVAVAWAVLAIAGAAASGPATEALDTEFSVPDGEGWETNVAISEAYAGTGDVMPLLPVVSLPEGVGPDDPQVQKDLRGLDTELKKALPNARILSYVETKDLALLSEDRGTVFSIVYPTPDPNSSTGENAPAEEAASKVIEQATVAGAPVHLTGIDALSTDSGNDAEGPGLLLEVVIGALGALTVLTFVFASFLALVPLLTAIVSILTTFLLLLGLTELATVSTIVQFLIALLGLGIAIDYSLLIVSRWREERAHGHSGDDAVQRAMETAGKAVIFSGITVAIGLMALIVLPLPFLRSMGYGGMLIPLVSTLCAITLLPVILARFGERLDWPHIRTDDRASRAWTRWAEAVARRRWLAAGAGMAVLLALVLAATDLRLGTTDVDALAKSGDSRVGLDALEDSGIGEGALLPHEVLVRGGDADAQALTEELASVEEVHGAVAPQPWQRHGASVIEVIPSPDAGSEAGGATLDAVNARVDALAPEAGVGGYVPANNDFIDAVYGSFPLMIALITITTFVLLARAFRSLLLPLKAIVLNILSVVAAWGVVMLVWQQGYGSELIWDIPATGSVPSWLPIMIFAFLFGLSMDYEVFILSRMREEFDRTGSTERAVVVGLGRTGRLVTSAALILFLAFVAMAASPGTDLKMFATALGAGILLDATLVRGLIVPAVIMLMGRWNWWLPVPVARVLRVQPSPLPARSASISRPEPAR